MSAPRAVSLIIVSRGRPRALQTILSALRFQTHPLFEVIVVSDQPAIGTEGVRHHHFSEPNISAARNIGIRMARGEIIAFCDDDAVPDPWWLERLSAAFEAPDTGFAGGYVRGRNGIEYQWRATGCDVRGDDVPIHLTGSDPVVLKPEDALFPRVHGTNCAFRADALRSIGGFDEGFRFFLDETDVCLRMGQAGWSCAIVPDAQVHHGFAASAHRTDDRVPRTLFDIGASKALFVAKHGAGKSGDAFAALRADRHRQLLQLMLEGRIEPRDVSRLQATLEEGLAKGAQSEMPDTVDCQDHEPLIPFVKQPITAFVALAGTNLSLRKMRCAAKKHLQSGRGVLMFRFSLTTLFHKRAFDEGGYWVQRGGLFGRSHRRGPLARIVSLSGRSRQEVHQLSRVFPVKRLTVFRKFRNSVVHLPQNFEREQATALDGTRADLRKEMSNE